mmetsp:Transcript_23371/g.66098  ORF Transcript_23371/g.66098 Transcript_23371/m.66098 type:complete len:405 (+) Transcript_23371:631-1845(+)
MPGVGDSTARAEQDPPELGVRLVACVEDELVVPSPVVLLWAEAVAVYRRSGSGLGHHDAVVVAAEHQHLEDEEGARTNHHLSERPAPAAHAAHVVPAAAGEARGLGEAGQDPSALARELRCARVVATVGDVDSSIIRDLDVAALDEADLVPTAAVHLRGGEHRAPPRRQGLELLECDLARPVLAPAPLPDPRAINLDRHRETNSKPRLLFLTRIALGSPLGPGPVVEGMLDDGIGVATGGLVPLHVQRRFRDFSQRSDDAAAASGPGDGAARLGRRRRRRRGRRGARSGSGDLAGLGAGAVGVEPELADGPAVDDRFQVHHAPPRAAVKEGPEALGLHLLRPCAPSQQQRRRRGTHDEGNSAWAAAVAVTSPQQPACNRRRHALGARRGAQRGTARQRSESGPT